MASHHDDMDDADFLAEVRESIDRASKPLPEMQAAAHVFVLRQGANDWVEVTSADWLAHRDQGAPLAGFRGDIHVASTVVSEGQIVNIRTSYRCLDDDGRLVALLDDLPYEEQQERDRLMVDANLSEAGDPPRRERRGFLSVTRLLEGRLANSSLLPASSPGYCRGLHGLPPAIHRR